MNITYPLLLDGGLSNELERQGCDLNQKLWSAKLLESNPEAIILAHLAYLESGAGCIITSSYQATLPGFMAIGNDEHSARGLILKSVLLAEEARSRFLSVKPQESKPIIAASIGPYGAYPVSYTHLMEEIYNLINISLDSKYPGKNTTKK